MNTRLAAALAGVAIVIAGTTYYLSPTPVAPVIVDQATSFEPVQAPASAQAEPTPNSYTGPGEIYPDVPGATNPDINQGNISQNLCNSSWSTRSIRPPVSITDPIKTVALARYNQEHSTTYTKADGELDHLISLELGGAPADPQNLWFEPYITQVNGVQVGAHEKDKVENALHKEVCAGTLTLDQAQSIITGDWYAYYVSHQL